VKSFCKHDHERSGPMKDLTSRPVDEYKLSIYMCIMELILSVAEFIKLQRMRNNSHNMNVGKQMAESGH
jgi:hypothetical protein